MQVQKSKSLSFSECGQQQSELRQVEVKRLVFMNWASTELVRGQSLQLQIPRNGDIEQNKTITIDIQQVICFMSVLVCFVLTSFMLIRFESVKNFMVF
jgi:hypothetical protein